MLKNKLASLKNYSISRKVYESAACSFSARTAGLQITQLFYLIPIAHSKICVITNVIWKEMLLHNKCSWNPLLRTGFMTSKCSDITRLYLFKYLIQTCRTLEFQRVLSFSDTLRNHYISLFILKLLWKSYKRNFLLSYVLIRIYDAVWTKLSISSTHSVCYALNLKTCGLEVSFNCKNSDCQVPNVVRCSYVNWIVLVHDTSYI